MPVLELALLIKIGSRIGVLPTVAVVVGTGLAGAVLARHQGFVVLSKIRRQLAIGILPTRELLGGAFVLAGALLLLTPGFVTDVVGLSLLIPPTRRLFEKALLRWMKRHVEIEFGAPRRL